MKKDKKNKKQQLKLEKAKGQTIVLFVFLVTVVILLAATVTDVGSMMLLRQRIKKAADSAALAGALDISSAAAAQNAAIDYAGRNGFTAGVNGVAVATEVDPTGENNNWFRVTITAPFHFFFGRLLGLDQINITRFSTAQFSSFVPISINMAGIYGEDHPAVTLMVRGTNSPYEHGDPYSVPLLDDGSPNPLYDGGGYNFKLYVPETYAVDNGTSMLKVELFDPDSYGDYDSSGTDTITTYQLFAPDLTPLDYTDDVLLSTYTVQSDRHTSGKWNTPSGFLVDTAVYGTGIYRINVTSGSGYNANGFHLRAGPDNDSSFNPDNGTKITSDGRLPLRFNQAGDTTMMLGNVPASAAGSQLHIKKFDTDIGSTQIVYSCDTLAQTWPGVLAGNGEWNEDVIDVPADYTGGNWYATYYAGKRDCSLWSLWYEGMTEGESGFVTLVE